MSWIAQKLDLGNILIDNWIVEDVKMQLAILVGTKGNDMLKCPVFLQIVNKGIGLSPVVISIFAPYHDETISSFK